MTFDTAWDSGARDRQIPMPTVLPQRLAALALGCVAVLCAYTVSVNLGSLFGTGDVAVNGAVPADAPAHRGDRLVPHKETLVARWNSYALLFSPRSWGIAPGTFALPASRQVASQQPAAQTAAVADAHTPLRPTIAARAGSVARNVAAAVSSDLHLPHLHNAPSHDRAAEVRDASITGSAGDEAVADPPEHAPTFFEKLFGKRSPTMLAYAAPEDGGLGADHASLFGGRYGAYTAVYDISAHVVYLPDGTKLEAHSGLGTHLDDPRSADERGRGVTPPDVYDLVPRESLFHGVRALRLIPEDQAKVFGRSGLLAHTFMLGPSGQSFGCVSFRDYNAFLKAYEDQKVKRLVVVARLD